MAVLGICRLLRNLNYTKFNKERISIYQRHKKNKIKQIHKILQFFVLIKRIRKKKLIKDKVQIENVNMRIIKWPQ